MSADTFPFEDAQPIEQGQPGWLNAAAREDDSPDTMDEIEVRLRNAADSLLQVHAATGIDLTQWPAMLAIVLLTYPHIVIEGTAGDGEHTIVSPHHETGRYWLDGNTLQPCNANAYYGPSTVLFAPRPSLLTQYREAFGQVDQ